ncbi:MAG: hypothetical protein HWQ38_16055 [Nostoc sp. NMS7]|uniref:hypothetical protein n=1 Tax=Nostoc sp. NMS7 TaxID=2815391 RepID=UPI0025FF09AB|nr:hypothetical protein [Nostoc sp. NMS7]MBN3947886.1 hypothetical protein [Nostoc sp. NMS7]
MTTYEDAKKREITDDKMEHDHIPAGESMRYRVEKEQDNDNFKIPDSERKASFRGDGKIKGDEWAYQNAPTIEIRGAGKKKTSTTPGTPDHSEGNDHNKYSATWGSRQKNKDTAIFHGKQEQLSRPEMDAELPGVAFHRDTDTMLNETDNLNRGTDDSLKQLGAYRYLYKQQIKQHNISPASPGYKMTGDPLNKNKKRKGGAVTYEHEPNKTQGQLLDSMFFQHSLKRFNTPEGVEDMMDLSD